MKKNQFDIIVIGVGSGGLSVGLFMAKAGFRVLMISKTDHDIGGDCLNDGCVPSKALIHIASIIHKAKMAGDYGWKISGETDFLKVMSYITSRQDLIRKHENAAWLREQGIEVALGSAFFTGKREVDVAGERYSANRIVIATGSQPAKLQVPGADLIRYLDNENVFELKTLPKTLLVVGGGPIGIELAQAMSRLGSNVTVVHNSEIILEHDEPTLAGILMQKLAEEGIMFRLNTKVESFTSASQALLIDKSGQRETIGFDSVFVAVGRTLNVEALKPDAAGIQLHDDKFVLNRHLQTTNKNIYVCGDVAGDLQFSHAAEFHARILINNFFSPLKKILNNRHMSWVTFTDPELATFGFGEKELKEKKIAYQVVEQSFNLDDRAVVEDFGYARLILYLSPKNLLGSQKILGGSMIAPHAGELIQELILANTTGLSINTIFNKIYPYPVASRINQQLVVGLKESALTKGIKTLLKTAYKIFS